MEATRKRMFHGFALAAALAVVGCAAPLKDKDQFTLQQMKALGTAGFDSSGSVKLDRKIRFLSEALPGSHQAA